MFFKKLDFIALSAFRLNGSAADSSKRYSVASHALAAALLVTCLSFSSGVVLRSALFSLMFFFIAYWLVSIFVYLYKKAQYGTFTRIIQRFWKRALYLFWMLEVSLFLIYLFLTVISPQEVAYMLDNQQLYHFYNNDLRAFFEGLVRPIIIILLTNACILGHKYNVIRSLWVLVIAVLLLNCLYDDFVQFYAINQHYSNYNWNHAGVEVSSDATIRQTHVGVWEYELAELKLRTYVHYLYLLTFLKLWHTLFIVYVFLFFENIRLRTGQTSFNVLSANLQNLYFLLFFNFILKVSLIKAYLNYLGGFAYYWFSVNQNWYDFSYVYTLFHHSYLTYIVSDVTSYL